MYKRKGQWRYRYGKLKDGVHANVKLNKVWIKTMDTVINKNMARSSSDSPSSDSNDDYDSDASDKRSWLY